MSLCLTGVGAPTRSVPSGSYFGRGLDLYLQGVTDRFIEYLDDSALKKRLTGVVIAGEQWQLCRMTMYVLGPQLLLYKLESDRFWSLALVLE